MNGGNVAGGLAAGIAQGILQKKARDRALEDKARQLELAKPMQDLQKQLLQLQIANQKTKQAQQATQNKFLDLVFQRMQSNLGGQQSAIDTTRGAEQQTPIKGLDTELPATPQVDVAPNIAPNIAPNASSGNVIDMMMGLDPTMMAFASKALGTDLLGAGRLAEQRRKNQVTESQYIAEDYIDETGAKRRRYRKKFGAPPSLSMQRGELIEPPEVESHTYEKEGKTFEVIRNARTGKPVTSPKEIKPVKGESSETASKISLAINALEYNDKLEKMFINPDGSINRQIILSGNAPFGGIGEGRTARSMFKDAMDARIRAATGAGMPKTEEANYDKMYWPMVLDSDELVKDKLKRLRSFTTDYLKVMDPSGRITRSLRSNEQMQKQYNNLRQQGLSQEEAAKKLGIK